MASSVQSNVMNFLNEVSSDFPRAISLAAGRPTEKLFDRLSPERIVDALRDYQGPTARGTPRFGEVLQYGRTAGIISDLVAAQLRTDQMAPARADSLLVTSGCQEAMVLALSAICSEPGDVLLLPNPTYTGVVGAAHACQVHTWPLGSGNIADAIEIAIRQVGRTGRIPRAVYLIPDFDNPTGNVICEQNRREILEVCARNRIIVLEDSAYSLFRFEGQSIPPMTALDEAGSVIYLSTYAKTLCPALRIGAMTLPETLFGSRDKQQALWQDLVQRKSYLTVNTSSICQAMVGGLLLDQRCSLRKWIEPALAVYRENRDAMLSTLASSLVSEDATWNRPEGGFFLTVNLPLSFGADAVVECATDYGVIAMPMAFFSFDASQDNSVRLSFSAASSAQIRQAVASFGRYVSDRLARKAVA